MSASGTYTLWVANTRIYYDGRIFSAAADLGGVGFYSLYIGCTLRDGTIIEPGNASDTAGTGIETASAMTQRFSGTGFPGLALVDFTNVYKLPLSLDTPMPISIPPVGAAVIGLTLDASAGDTLTLDFERTSGNLNLGIVVLSPNNEVVFQASLVTLEAMSARIALRAPANIPSARFASPCCRPTRPKPPSSRSPAR